MGTLPFIDLKADDLSSLRKTLEEAIIISKRQATEMAAGRVGKDTRRCEKPGRFCRQDVHWQCLRLPIWRIYHRDLPYWTVQRSWRSNKRTRLDPLTRIILINPGPQLGKIDRRVKLMAEIIYRYLGISTKGHTVTQRKRNPTQSLDFVIQNDTALDVSAMVFLSNHCNKYDF